MRKLLVWVWLIALAMPCAWATARGSIDLAGLSLEELMNVEVSLVSRKPEKLIRATAAIYALTQEDLRGSGARSIPEALRLVPGVQVGRMDANKWALSARGFSDIFANKLLVLIDGRSIYNPQFSGVFWESRDVVLEDVERIEVIRGPGGTLWGANAVNGVINVATRSARDTQGWLLQAGGGSQERAFGTLRYGGSLGETAWFRLFTKSFQRQGSRSPSGLDLEDDWTVSRVGGRLDWAPSSRDFLTLQGDAYSGEVGQTWEMVTSLEPPYRETFAADSEIEGGHLRGRWERRFSEDSDLALQVYYDLFGRMPPPVGGYIHSLDADFQHRFPLTRRQELIWGLGYRSIIYDVEDSFTYTMEPIDRHLRLFSLFAQDDFALVPERLRLTFGTKVEHHDFTGFEIQPSIRFLWTPHLEHAFWGAISRAVRTPSRADRDQRFIAAVVSADELSAPLPGLVMINGDEQFTSEILLAFDLGYRTHFGNHLSLDLATFYNIYDDLRSTEPALPFRRETPSPPHLVIPLVAANKLSARTSGVELAVDWQALAWWRLRSAYTFLYMELELEADSSDRDMLTVPQENPEHQLNLRSSMKLFSWMDFDMALRYVDDRPVLDIDRYLALDVRLGWQLLDGLECTLAGQHLLSPPHLEFTRQVNINLPGQVKAGFYSALTWKF